MNDPAPLRIGTRGSPLALAQAEDVRRRLAAAVPGLTGDIVIIKTTGDQVLDQALALVGGKGLFTKEIDEAMLAGQIDVAVHSMKDVPTWLPDGIVLPCMLEREDVRDAFLSPRAASLAALAPGSVVGTASLRRQAQLLALRPDLRVQLFRGNVQTRLGKLEAGEADATLLALAGLNRLGLSAVATEVLAPETMLPAVGQGAVGVTCRAGDAGALDVLAQISHPGTVIRVTAERAFLAVLDGSCRTPIAGLAELSAGGLRLRGLIAKPDGSKVHRTEQSGDPMDAAAIGRRAGEALLGQCGPGFLATEA